MACLVYLELLINTLFSICFCLGRDGTRRPNFSSILYVLGQCGQAKVYGDSVQFGGVSCIFNPPNGLSWTDGHTHTRKDREIKADVSKGLAEGRVWDPMNRY